MTKPTSACQGELSVHKKKRQLAKVKHLQLCLHFIALVVAACRWASTMIP